MAFRDLNLKFYYNNDDDDLINDFYIPVIEETKIYKRSTGFFSSSSFWEIIDGLKNFLVADGKIQLIVSPNLSEKDIEAINLGEKAKEDSVEAFIIANILEDKKYEDQFNLLAWLIYQEKLEIKFVIKKDINNFGIFHDKTAIMIDEKGDKVAFHGSLNESITAYKDNFEAINVFMGWIESDSLRISKIDDAFESIWNNKSSNWESYSISESIKREIIKKRKENINFYKLTEQKLTLPDSVKLRDYQEKAINSWIANKFSGILEMATGSGKTFTAIVAMSKAINFLMDNGYSCGAVIVVPYKNLLEQWCRELKKFNVEPIRCYKNKLKWYYELSNAVNDFNKGKTKNLFVITTNVTYTSESFQDILKNIKRDYIFCVDEMHHLAAPKISKLLPENAQLRLGLTATLCDEDEDNKFKDVLNYFGQVVFQFTIEDAINNGCLTKYNYYPIFIELNDYELSEYRRLSKRISQKYFSGENIDDEGLTALINQRRRIILNAENKIVKFGEMKSELEKYSKALVYCGDRIDEEGRFIDKINRMVYDMGISTHTYSSSLNDSVRTNVIKRFQDGEINVLTAIRCLDEGIDIPSLECAFILASNMDSKQFIQRRGRILRKSEGKELAYIYDFVVVPTLDEEEFSLLDYEEQKAEAKIFGKELKRVYEFARICENRSNVISQVTKILSLYSNVGEQNEYRREI